MKRRAGETKQRLQDHLRFEVDGLLEHVDLGRDRYDIGFVDGCGVRLPGRPLLGRRVARLERRPDGGWTIEPLSGFVRTRVDNKRVKGTQPLEDGAVIGIKGFQLVFHRAWVPRG